MNCKKIRIGLLINGRFRPYWEQVLIKRLLGLDFVEIALVIERDPDSVKKSVLKKIRSSWRRSVYTLYDRFENNFLDKSNNAFKSVDLSDDLAQIPTIKVFPKMTKFSDRFSDDDITSIEEYNLDVLIRLGFRILRGKILKLPKHGVWSFHHGDNRFFKGGPPGFWESILNKGKIGSILQVLNEDLDGGLVIAKSTSAIHSFSYKKALNEMYFKTLMFYPRKLKQLYDMGATDFFDMVKKENEGLSIYDSRLYVPPNNLIAGKLILFKYLKYIFRKIENLPFMDQWILYYHFGKSSDFNFSFWRMKKLIPPKDRFWADPFMINNDGKVYLFFEEQYVKQPNGHICCVQIDKKGMRSSPEIVLKEQFHISYPNVFSFNGDFYMLPETGASNQVRLYKSKSFPNEWVLERVLIDNIKAYDPTVIFKDGLWWLFVNVVEQDGSSSLDELYLYYSESLISDEWTPHRLNPIISDVTKARPAGRIFELDGDLIRPSQDSSFIYGRAVNFNRIETMSITDYIEVPIEIIEPNWEKGLLGVHTFNKVENVTVIDGRKKVSRL